MIVTDPTGRVLWPDSHAHHRWSPAACPVRDPGTGTVIGAVDLARPARAVHPTTFELVRAAARLTEGLLAAQQAVRAGMPPAQLHPLPSRTKSLRM
jgi:transcriptional regulator of acetoin/glycerol metabolism